MCVFLWDFAILLYPFLSELDAPITPSVAVWIIFSTMFLSSTYLLSSLISTLFFWQSSTNSSSQSAISSLAISPERSRLIGEPFSCTLVSLASECVSIVGEYHCYCNFTFPITFFFFSGMIGRRPPAHISCRTAAPVIPGLHPRAFVLLGKNSTIPHSLTSSCDFALLEMYLAAISQLT